MTFLKTRCSECLKATNPKFAIPAKTFVPPSRAGRSNAGGMRVPHVVSPRLAKQRGETRGNEPRSVFPRESSICTAGSMARASSRSHLKPVPFAPWQVTHVGCQPHGASPGWGSPLLQKQICKTLKTVAEI